MPDDRFLRNLTLKTLRDQRRALLGWSLALVALCVMIAAVFPSIRSQAADFERLIESYPPAMKAFFGGLEEMTTPEGYLRAELFSSMLPLLVLIFAIGRGADAIAGDEDRGVLEMLLAYPLTRRRVLLEKTLAMVLGVLLLAGVSCVALLAGGAAFGMDVSALRLGAATLQVAVYGLAMGLVALAVGAATGRRGLAIAVAAGVAALGFLLDGLSRLATSLEWARWLSPHHYYASGDPLREGLDPLGLAVLAGLGLASLAVALWGFDRRDLGRA